MREILLRAYDKGRKEYLSDGHLFIAINKSRCPSESEIYLDVINNAYKYKERFVIERYTGLTDKNGTKIFEGDICSSGGMIYQIIWLDDKYGWFCKVLKSNSCLIDTTMAFPLYQYDNRPENGYRQLEIIGNIHDNPEPLKGGDKG